MPANQLAKKQAANSLIKVANEPIKNNTTEKKVLKIALDSCL